MTTEIKIGDYVEGKYNFGHISGIVLKINKNVLVLRKCITGYNWKTEITTIEVTDENINLTKTRIRRIGFEENSIVIN